MKLREIMTSDVQCATPSTDIVEVARMMRDQDTGAIPVCEGEQQLLGIITDRDIVVRIVADGKDAMQAKASDYMSSDIVTAHPDMDVAEALTIMGDEQIRRLPVVDAGKLVGIVSLGDLAIESDEQTEVAESLTEISQEDTGKRAQRRREVA